MLILNYMDYMVRTPEKTDESFFYIFHYYIQKGSKTSTVKN